MRRFVWTILIIAVIATIVNDAVRWGRANSELNLATNQLAAWASANGRDLAVDQTMLQLTPQAQRLGVTIDGYQKDSTGLQLSTRAEVSGTWVVGAVIAMREGVPFRQALTTPFPIQKHLEAMFQ
ncbi:MAG: hypothetical protein HGA39_08195 [Coriobacteriia bacterium]|nr:hypothetical protein [Coriobacteriia bacterium]